jgi:hypothetical protein
LQQARADQDQPDIEQAQGLARVYSEPPVDSTLRDIVPDFETLMRAARRCSDLELERMQKDVSLADIVSRLVAHGNKTQGQMAIGYVPMISEMLSDFTPETVCNVIINAKRIVPQMMGDCLCATLYLAANCDGVERRDACRLATLLLLIPLEGPRVYRNYRELVLAPSAAPGGSLAPLASAMRDELHRIHPYLPRLLAEQPPITNAEIVQAQREILSRLSGPLPPANPNFSSERTGKPGLLSRLFGRGPSH